MDFISVRDFRTSPKNVWDKLHTKQELIITNNGKPSALMILIDESSFDETLNSIRQARAIRAVNRMQMASVKAGTDKMSLEEINAEIAAAREEK